MKVQHSVIQDLQKRLRILLWAIMALHLEINPALLLAKVIRLVLYLTLLNNLLPVRINRLIVSQLLADNSYAMEVHLQKEVLFLEVVIPLVEALHLITILQKM